MNELLCTRLVRRRAVSWNDAADEYNSAPCESCGRYFPLERHHRKFRSRGGIWTPANVLLLCRSCHLAATDEAPWTQGSGLNVHTWQEPEDVPVTLWYVDRPVLLNDHGGYTPPC